MAHRPDRDAVGNGEYEAPELTVVGQVGDVVLGIPGGGFDGPNGMTEPQFEFEADSEDQ